MYLKANYPAAGTDFVKILNTMYPTPSEQHDFMFSHMIPTMTKVLGEIRDFVTTKPNRDYFINFTLHPTIIPLTSVTWDWSNYYRYLSLNGLQEASCFKVDFPQNSFEYNVFTVYNSEGHKYIDK